MFKNAHIEIMTNHVEGFQNHKVPKRIYRTHQPYYPPDFDRFWISKRIPPKRQNTHPNRNSKQKSPSWEQTCPTFGNEKSSTQKWFGNVIVPRRVVFFLGFVETFFFAAVQPRLVWLCSSPSWSKAMKLPSRPKLGTCASSHARRNQTIQNTGPIVLAKKKMAKKQEIHRERERETTDNSSWLYRFLCSMYIQFHLRSAWQIIEQNCALSSLPNRINTHQDFPNTKTKPQMVVSQIFGWPVGNLQTPDFAITYRQSLM